MTNCCEWAPTSPITCEKHGDYCEFTVWFTSGKQQVGSRMPMGLLVRSGNLGFDIVGPIFSDVGLPNLINWFRILVTVFAYSMGFCVLGMMWFTFGEKNRCKSVWLKSMNIEPTVVLVVPTKTSILLLPEQICIKFQTYPSPENDLRVLALHQRWPTFCFAVPLWWIPLSNAESISSNWYIGSRLSQFINNKNF